MSEKTHLESVSASYRSRGTAFTDTPDPEPTASGESFEGKQSDVPPGTELTADEDGILRTPDGEVYDGPVMESAPGTEPLVTTPVGEPQDGTTVAEGETEPVPEAPVAEGDSTTE